MSRRFSLREYQQSMLVRMEGSTATSQADARLGIEIGARKWLLALGDTAEVLPVPAIADVPLSKSWFRGVANVRGSLMSVVDLQSFFGEGAQSLSQLSRLLLIQPRILPHASVLVGRMLGIKHLAEMTQQSSSGDQPAWVVAQYQDKTGQDWYELDVKQLALEPAFLHTGIIA